jgi:hypothetical protein
VDIQARRYFRNTRAQPQTRHPESGWRGSECGPIVKGTSRHCIAIGVSCSEPALPINELSSLRIGFQPLDKLSDCHYNRVECFLSVLLLFECCKNTYRKLNLKIISTPIVRHVDSQGLRGEVDRLVSRRDPGSFTHGGGEIRSVHHRCHGFFRWHRCKLCVDDCCLCRPSNQSSKAQRRPTFPPAASLSHQFAVPS